MEPSRFIAGTRGSYGFEVIDMEFGADWKSLAKKIIFCPPGAPPVSVVWAGVPFPVPAEVMSVKGKTSFAVVGYENEKTKITVMGEIDVLGTVDVTDGAEAMTPTESEVAQIFTYMERAVACAEEVRADADRGAFNGRGWSMGTAITGKGEAIEVSIANTLKGDMYLNTDTFEVYRAVENDKWSYMGTLKGDTGAAAGWGTPRADIRMIEENSQPTVKVTASGDDTAKELSFSFGIPSSYAIASSSGVAKYSVRFENGATVGTREDAAVGMIAEVAVDDQVVRNDFDSVPFYDRRICNAVWDKQSGKWRVKAYKGDSDFAWDGSNGDVLYECKPFYISNDTDLWSYVSVCGSPCDGYSLAPMFRSPTEKVYLPCFETYFSTPDYSQYTPRSYAGVASSSFAYNSLIGFVNSYCDEAELEGMDVLYSELALMMVEFATKDMGSVMRGASELTNGLSDSVVKEKKTNSSFTVTPTVAARLVVGQSISLHETNVELSSSMVETKIIDIRENVDGNFLVTVDNDIPVYYAGYCIFSKKYRTGVAAMAVTSASSGSAVANDGKHPCIWRGKENPWGNSRRMLGGVFAKHLDGGGFSPASAYYRSQVPMTSGYFNMCNYTLPESSGFVSRVGSDRVEHCVTLPTEVGASDGIYFESTPMTVDAVLCFGGSYRDGSKCGIYYSIDCNSTVFYPYASTRCYMRNR